MSDKQFDADHLHKEIQQARSYTGLDKETGDSETVPLGYVPIALSSQGNMFAPDFVHARSFKTGDMAHLSLLRADRLPENNIRVIRSVLHEDSDPAHWHIKEIIEFLLKHYLTYFGAILKDVPWPVNDDDREHLKNKDEDQYNALQKGDYVPRVDVDITQLKFKELDKPSRTITIKPRSGEGEFKFRMPQFGDVVTLRTYMKAEFGASDATYEAVRQAMESGSVDSQQQQEYQEYIGEKLEVASNVNMALLLREVDGIPIESLEHALKFVTEDPRFDYSLSKKLKETCDIVADKFGVDENVTLKNPVTNKKVTRRLQFRLYDILKAILVSEPDTYDVVIDS